ncbi:hypothetical protein ON010_g17195 [Phytophthora cinnamomi]|nr:hypothetical protein ON010_g17195 [Phytophthora cinnamomi]
MSSSNIGATPAISGKHQQRLQSSRDLRLHLRQIVGHEGRAILVAARRVRHHDAAAAPAAPPSHYPVFFVWRIDEPVNTHSAISPLFYDAQAYSKTSIALSKSVTGLSPASNGANASIYLYGANPRDLSSPQRSPSPEPSDEVATAPVAESSHYIRLESQLEGLLGQFILTDQQRARNVPVAEATPPPQRQLIREFAGAQPEPRVQRVLTSTSARRARTPRVTARILPSARASPSATLVAGRSIIDETTPMVTVKKTGSTNSSQHDAVLAVRDRTNAQRASGDMIEWIMDSGAQTSVSSDLTLFTELREDTVSELQFGNETTERAAVGTAHMMVMHEHTGKEEERLLDNVSYAKSAPYYLISQTFTHFTCDYKLLL